MIEGKKVLAIIPARGGSKGVTRKNIRKINGSPLIEWTISAANSSKYIDKIIVSTDDDEIASIIQSYKACSVVKRPPELATDKAEVIDAVLHALSFNQNFEIGVLLQPTSPLRTNIDIDSCLEIIVEKGAKSCISITEVSETPYWMYRIDKSRKLIPLLEDYHGSLRRQDLPIVYKSNGALFAFLVDWLKSERKFITDETYAYLMPKERSLDIDTEFDLRVFEEIIKRGRI